MVRAPIIALLTLTMGCGTERAPRDAACRYNSDCADALVCADGTCRAECAEDRDCEAEWSCGPSGVPRVRACLPPASPVLCAYDSECPAGARCIERRCRPQCLADVDCPAGGVCSQGTCDAPLSTPARTDGGAPDAGAGPDGGCASRCGARCVDPSTDLEHCGGCGLACEPGSACVEGRCECCVEGYAACPGRCADLATNNRHCGACGVACPDGRACRDGRCAPGNDACWAAALLVLDPGGRTQYEQEAHGGIDGALCSAELADVFFRVRVATRAIVYIVTEGEGEDHRVRRLPAPCEGIGPAITCTEDTCAGYRGEWLGVLEPGDHDFVVEGDLNRLLVEHVPIGDVPHTRVVAGEATMVSGTGGGSSSTCGASAPAHVYYWASCSAPGSAVTADACGSAGTISLALERGDRAAPTCAAAGCAAPGDDAVLDGALAGGVHLFALFVRGEGGHAVSLSWR